VEVVDLVEMEVVDLVEMVVGSVGQEVHTHITQYAPFIEMFSESAPHCSMPF
jgi:hypothetical protein